MQDKMAETTKDTRELRTDPKVERIISQHKHDEEIKKLFKQLFEERKGFEKLKKEKETLSS
jgi:hypothetical protein